MHYRPVILFIVLWFVAAACDSSTNTGGNASQKQQDVAEEDIYAYIDAWQGNVDGKYPALMWYRIYGDVVSGYLFYTDKSKDSVRLIGTTLDSTVRLLEMWPDGNITGVWDLKIHPSAAEGSWFSPLTRKQYNASLMHIDTAVVIPRIDSVADVSGVYRYGYSEQGAQGYMKVVAANGKLAVRFQNVTDAPSRNLAELGPFEAEMKNNELSYQSSEYGDCTVRIRFFNGFAVVNYVEEQSSCGFGHNATVDGIYIKQ